MDAHLSDVSDPVAVAVSGGGDSVAALWILRDWAALRGRSVAAFVVDHGLRAGSAQAATWAAERARAAGATARVLTWREGAAGGQEAARDARHRLLAGACAACGATALITGHTRDDQAETVLMRLARPAGARALSALAPVAPSPAWPEGRGLALYRPLLTADRGGLRARLSAAGGEWLEDPANADRAFERVRARARLAALAGAGVEARRVADVARRAGDVDGRVRAAAMGLFHAAVGLEPEGWARLDRGAYRAGEGVVRRRVLEALIAAVSGDASPVNRDALARLDRELAGRGFAGATLGGARFVAAQGEAVVAARDVGVVLGRSDGACVRGGQAVAGVWDGRFALDDGTGGVVALGARARDLGAADRARLARLPAAVRPSAPARVGDDGNVNLLGLSYLGAWLAARVLAPHRPLAWRDAGSARAALGGPRDRHHVDV